MAPRRKNASIKATGSTSSKAEPLPEWVKNKNIAKPPPKYIQAQQQQQQQQQQQKQGRASPSLANVAEAPPPRPPPLFPPGTKTPINLLNERIQKHYSSQGWLKPNIDARKVPKQEQQTDTNLLEGEKWTFVVTLVKTNKADQNNPDTVRFDGRDPSGFEGSSVALSSKEEAKHWGATYALFRLFSNLSLYQVLPSGPREYWKKLSNHKANAPDHLNWLWAADPFEAVQKVAMEKEAKKEARLKREEEEVDKGPRLSKAWQEAREVRMAKELRDAVEATVKKALQLYPAEIKSSLRLEAGTSQEEEEEANQDLVASLLKLGFRKGHARSACVWLRQARRGQSTLSASLASISNLGDLDACLEYLTIFCPEEDLPKVFAPSIRADSFVTSSASAGHEEQLAIRWIEDRLVKLAGYPRIAVSKALASMKDLAVQDREAACTDLLLCNLSEIEKVKIDKESVDVNRKTRSDARIEERITLEAILGPERIKIIPTSEKALSGDKMSSEEFYDIVISHVKEDIRLRISPGEKSKYPEKGNGQAVPTFFVASTTLPAYLRLALTRRLGRILFALEDGYDDWKEMIEAGQGGILLAMVEELESCWQSIVDDPPELAMVMKGVTVKAKLTPREDKQNETNGQAKRTIKTVRRPLKISRNAKEDEELKHAQARLWQSFDYKPFASTRNNLPAMASKDTILSLLEKNRILIIAGETGCGKTTQCPQFVLDDFIERGKGSLCNIIVTQPRRLSAMGVASRVSAERCEDLNGQGRVGYAIRGERKAGRQTKLLFSTIGVLLRRLSQHDRNLDGVSHIFVDEVHERGVESDLLLLELREVLRRNSTLRVILMSATIDQETFSRYFDSAPVITIPGRTHPVTDYYLEDVKSLIETFQEDKERTYGIDYNLIGATTKMICERALNMGNLDGAILIFCPGVGEIRLAMDVISRELRGGSVEVMPLHANLTPEEQRRVFKRTRAGIRKIVVSTNVAETSITIDDVVYVIDVGLVKETRYDPISGLTRLMETRCSRAASKQRRGRAGRVQSGECFKLFSRSTEEQKMEAQQIPEIRRMSLENLILTVKALKGEEDHPAEYLAKAISPPSVAAIEKAMLLLAEMNIITGKNKLTALGKHVSLLPLDVRLAKLLVFGCIFHCLDPILTIASLLSCKPLFAGPYEKREEVSAAKLKFQIGSSDVLTDANAFQQWTMMKKAKASSSEMKKWCEDYFISSSSIRDIASTRIDLLGNLIELGFIPIDYGKDNSSSSYLDTNAVDVNLKKSLLLAGLYPSVVRIVHPKARFDQSSSGAIQRESEAKQVRYFDDTGQRVFLHPSSMLFSQNKYQSEFLTFFAKSVSKSRGGGASDLGEKIYLRDANEVPIFAMLLFGGKMKVHRLQGGISMSCASDQEEGWIKFRASARIATLIQHLRFLLDAALEKSFENPTENVFQQGLEAEVRDCLQRVLDKDGLS